MKKSFTEINPEQFKAFTQLPMDTSVVMLNLLRFKEIVPETKLSGAESYKLYMKAATPFFIKVNAEVIYMGKPQLTLIGSEDENLWDKVLLIKYNTVADFLEMVKAEGYPAHLRKQALSDSRLIYCNS